jgi:hypothetical protein
MPPRHLIVRRLALFLVTAGCFLVLLGVEPDSGRARIALFEPSGQKNDVALSAVLATVADSVELSLDVLQLFEVKRLPTADPAKDLDRVRAYCQQNRIDQAILGSGSVRRGGGYLFKLVVYDRRTDSITITQQGESKGALDMFDVTDTLVASLLDGLSGTHLVFGSLTVESDPAGALITLNGKDVGAAPVSLRGLPVGTVQLVGRADGHEEARASVTIVDGDTVDAPLTLTRSTGTLAMVMPKDALAAVRSTEVGQKDITGPGAAVLPTGDYDVEASCPGLPAFAARVTVRRDEKTNLLPWPKAYLDVKAEPVDATILVDGVERGAAPLVVEVEPGTLHRVELKKDKYVAYRADVTEDAGSKSVFSGRLTPVPGSLRVETSITGAAVTLDDGSRKAVTPALFDNVSPGEHLVSIADASVGDRIFTAGEPVRIQVSPGETALVSPAFVEAKASLTVTDAPEGSFLEIDGVMVGSGQGLTSGTEVPAGTLNVSVMGPNSQWWTEKLDLGVNEKKAQSIYSMTWRLARRTIRMDGKTNDWGGLQPVWIPIPQLVFPNQPGTRITKGFACRDDNNLYFKYEFVNGSPRLDLSKEIRSELDYIQILYTNKGEITARTRFQRGLFGPSSSTTLGIRDPITGSWQGLGDGSVKFQISENALEVAVPLAPLKKVLTDATRSGGFLQAALLVVDVQSDGSWSSFIGSGKQEINLE